MNKDNTCQHVCTWKLESGFTCQHIYKYVWKSLMKGFTFSMHVLYIKRKSSFIFFWRSRKCPYIKSSSLHHYICIYMPKWRPKATTIMAHDSTNIVAPSHQAPKYIYIYILKRNTCKFEEVKISSGKFNLDWRTPKDQKSSLIRFRSSLSTIIPFI